METRYVGSTSVVMHAFSAIAFGLFFYFDVGETDFVGQWALVLFSSVGAIFLFVRLRFPNIWGHGHPESLLFSHKTIGGFKLSFLYYLYVPLIFTTSPEIPRMVSNEVLWMGFVALMILWVITLIVYLYKNSSFYH